MWYCYTPAAPRDAGWWQLLESLCDATATESDYRTVQDLLDADHDFRRFYTAYASDEAALQEQHRKSLPHGRPHLLSRPTQPASVSDG